MPHGPHAVLARKATRTVVRAVLVAAVAAAAATPAVAGAASVAYVDNGEAWLSSLDGTQKARLAVPVVNDQGDREDWLDIAQSDGGRIVAVRNGPGPISSSNVPSFKIWEPDGTSTVEGPLNATSGWASYVYPLGFDITADGSHLVYGYSNMSDCCPSTPGHGTYVRPATNSAANPIDLAGETRPSLFGARVVSLNASISGRIDVQNAAAGNPETSAFAAWFDVILDLDLDLEGVDVAANGSLAALGYSGSAPTVGKIAVFATQGVDQSPFPSAIDCFLPAAGVAREASLAQDAGAIAWKDDGGVKVAGTPTTANDPCEMTSAPVVLSPTGTHPSIGGANVAAFVPGSPANPSPPPVVPGPVAGAGAPPAPAPVMTLPAKVTVKALAARRGVSAKVKVSGPGKISITGTVPARRLGRRGKPVVVVTGKGSAQAAGTVTIKLRLAAAGRKGARRLKGARLTLRAVQGSRSVTKVVKLR